MFDDKHVDWYANPYYQPTPVGNGSGNSAESRPRLPSATDACYDHDWMETLQIVKTGASKAERP